MEYEHIVHSFEPVYDKASEILILGTLPSVKSRENNFYYGRFFRHRTGNYQIFFESWLARYCYHEKFAKSRRIIFYPKCCFNAIRFNEPRAD